jgi:hypothetical protein
LAVEDCSEKMAAAARAAGSAGPRHGGRLERLSDVGGPLLRAAQGLSMRPIFKFAGDLADRPPASSHVCRSALPPLRGGR